MIQYTYVDGLYENVVGGSPLPAVLGNHGVAPRAEGCENTGRGCVCGLCFRPLSATAR